MTQLTDAPPTRGAPASPLRMIGVVCAAHFMSHYFIIILAPLLPFVRAEYNVSYTEIGLALTTFNIVSTLLQTPAGFLIDRLGARLLLVAGLVLGSMAFLLAGFVNSFWFLVAMFALAGIGNTVYHPADYALLSRHVPAQRIGQAFSIHTFSGVLGSAVAPPTLLLMQSAWGWRGAFIGAGIMGLVVALAVLMVREQASATPATPKPGAARDGKSASWDLLLSPPILLNLVFFILIAVMNSGMSNYSVVALGALYGTPVTIANTALTAMLTLSAIGVLAGGLLVTRTALHSTVAALGIAGAAVAAALIATFDFGTLLLIAVMAAQGFSTGIIAPSRDMIVRDATPEGSFGKVFGFVTTGFNLGGIVAPVIFGALMDAGNPRLVFVVVAAAALIAILTVTTLPKRPREAA
ncbi:MFS transporter [Undibacter mobilis]|uniref:MFS transporter n=1 Tax=Undibacter mobilis TaxID=2292256 RepID=A0A371B374_9BRAD|nr:MFS transporter [Undibacter mobilis]RDV01903.1 MFS transporter [Undibacter mobilis]